MGNSRLRSFGFQYLRMLFGANTCKPDLRIRQWVGEALGRKVSDIVALKLMEGAALEAGVLLRDADTTIWEMKARGSDNSRAIAGRSPHTSRKL